MLASFLPTGSISWLYYSDRLSELPLGVFGVAIATVILPSLSREHAQASADTFARLLDWALKMILMLALPATLALLLLAEPILVALFHYGEFGIRDIHMAALSLQAYALGLPAFMLIKVLASGYYARQDMRTPVSIGIRAMVANMIMNLLLVVPLHAYFGIGHVGLALATSLAAWLNASLLFFGLLKAGVYGPAVHTRTDLLKILLALAALLLALVLAMSILDDLVARDWVGRVGLIIAIAAGGSLLYGGVLALCRPAFLLHRPKISE